MPQDLAQTIGRQSPRPRIVQHRNRRYSVRLEPVFWQALETLAAQQGMRLGRYVAELAERYAGANFSSHLRVVCMLETQRALARSALRPGGGSLLDVVLASTSPGLVLSRYRTVVACNKGFDQWLGPEPQALTGADLTSIVQVRTRRPLNELWLDLVAGAVASAEVHVLHVAPGRALAAPGRLLALHDAEDFYAVLWLAVAPRRVAPQAPLRRPGPRPDQGADPAP